MNKNSDSTMGHRTRSLPVSGRHGSQGSWERGQQHRLESYNSQALDRAVLRCREYLRAKPTRERRHNLSLDEFLRAEELFAPGNNQEVISEKLGIRITKEVIRCLREPEWLNDEVINFYVNLLQERNDFQLHHAGLTMNTSSKTSPNDNTPVYPSETQGSQSETGESALPSPNARTPPRVYFFSTFFFTKLSNQDSGGNYCYANVQRWTRRKRVDIFLYDWLLIPVHVGKAHWTLGAINFRRRLLYFFDSLHGGYGPNFAEIMHQYLHDEHMDKKNTPFPDLDSFSLADVTETGEVPAQANSSDCGVFTCQFAECIGDGRWEALGGFDFSQRDMKVRRRKMAVCISRGRVD